MANPDLPSSYEYVEGAVRYNICGTGPDVVLVHGTPWSSYSWHRLLPALTSYYRVHYYDLIGYGQSQMHSKQNISLAAQGHLLAELIAHWGLHAPSLVAHDIGGAISLRAHLLHAVELTKLILINVVALAPWGSAFFTHVRQYESAFAGVPRYIHRAIVEAYVRGAMNFEPDPERLASLVSPWLGAEGQMAFYRQIAQADQMYTDEIEPLYGQLRCSVSILWGEDDAWIPLATGRRLHAAIPKSNFTVVPSAGHLAQLDADKFVNERILRFLDS